MRLRRWSAIPNLSGGGEEVFLISTHPHTHTPMPPPTPLCWFSLDGKSCNPDILQHSVTFGIPNLLQSPDTGQNWDKDISDYRISAQSLIKENCHNSRTRDDIDMKLGPVTKLDKRNKTTSKKFDVDVMSENCDVIVIFRIFGQFGAVRRPDSGHRVCKSYVFSNSNLLSYKNWKQN